MAKRLVQSPQVDGGASSKVETTQIGLRFDGHSADSRPEGVELLPGKSNYYVGPREAWRVGVPRWGRVRYPELYSGVDAVFYERDGHLKYDFVVAPGASPSSIRFSFPGVQELEIMTSGDLRISSGSGGEILHAAPFCYQTNGSSRNPVAARFRRFDRSSVGFEVDSYDPTLPLVIDPLIGYGTYLGGNLHDYVVHKGLEVDTSGKVYASGTTRSIAGTLSGRTNFDGFAAKIDPELSPAQQIRYLTYFGGQDHEEEIRDLYVDPQGKAYVSGWTASATFLPYPGCQLGDTRPFYVRLDASGQLQGGASLNCTLAFGQFNAIAADTGGNVFVVGDGLDDLSPQPVFAPAYPDPHGSGTFARFDAGDTLTHVGHLGASGTDVAVGDDGSVYVGGAATSPLPSTYFAFAARIASDLQSLHYLTGLTDPPLGQLSVLGALVLDPSGSVIVSHVDQFSYPL